MAVPVAPLRRRATDCSIRMLRRRLRTLAHNPPESEGLVHGLTTMYVPAYRAYDPGTDRAGRDPPNSFRSLKPSHNREEHHGATRRRAITPLIQVVSVLCVLI